ARNRHQQHQQEEPELHEFRILSNRYFRPLRPYRAAAKHPSPVYAIPAKEPTVLHDILTVMAAFLKAPSRGRPNAGGSPCFPSARSAGLPMHSDSCLFEGPSPPLAQLGRVAALWPAQNQLRQGPMAEIEARPDWAPAAGEPLVQAQGWRPRLGGTLTGALALLALLAAGAAEYVVLGLLGALAVGGAFLLFGLLSGFLRFGERVAAAETAKAIADGLETGLQVVDPKGRVLYRNRALEALTGRRAGRHTTLEELFAGEP